MIEVEPPYPGRFIDRSLTPADDRRIVTPRRHHPGLRGAGVHDHRAPARVAAVPVLDDSSVGEHKRFRPDPVLAMTADYTAGSESVVDDPSRHWGTG